MSDDNEVIKCITDDHDCPDCRLAVGTGQTLNICKHLGFDDCDELHEKVISEEITPIELIDIMLDRTKKNKTEYHETFESLKELMTTPIGQSPTS